MITKDTLLASLGIPHLGMILEEAFACLLWQSGALSVEELPATIADLAERACLPVDQVITRLESIITMTQDIEISPQELDFLLRGDESTRPVLLDVREDWEFEICHLPGSLKLHEYDFANLLAVLRDAPQVVTICHHGIRSLSAALFLKEKGVARVRSLAGGVELWARVVDPSLARY